MGTINSNTESVNLTTKCDNPIQEKISSVRALWELTVQRRWAMVGLAPRTKKDGTEHLAKAILNASTQGNAMCSNVSTWKSFDLATKNAYRWNYPNVAIGLSDGLTLIDFDDPFDTEGNLKPTEKAMIEELDSYTEVSPSGKGIHVLAKCTVPFKGCAVPDGEPYKLEMYCPDGTLKEGKITHGRFSTITGNVYGEEKPIQDRTNVITKIFAEWFGPFGKYPGGKKPSAKNPAKKKAKILTQEQAQEAAKRAEDPREKSGVVGAFCRVHPIREVIETMLSDVYEPGTKNKDRYTFIAGDGVDGLAIYNDLWAYSFHATDPAGQTLCNAFDLYRIHRYGDQGDSKSFKAMRDFALKDPKVQAEIDKESARAAEIDFSEPAGDDDWKTTLERDKDGEVIASERNTVRIMWNDPELQNFGWNELFGKTAVTGDLPWKHRGEDWSDGDSSQLYTYISSNYKIEPAQPLFRHAIATVTGKRSFNPLQDYINNLPAWDGIQRVDTLLIDYLGAEDNEYTRAVTRKTLVGAIKRALEPGCKFETVLTLVGPQGIGKSTLLDKLGGKWYSDSLSLEDTRDKRGAELIGGVWIMELGELQGMRRADLDKMKNFISCKADRYRGAYRYDPETHPRTGIICGTTNHSEGFLRDTTGNRRWWPVHVSGRGVLSVWDDLTDDVRNQIWAESKRFYEQGEKPYIDNKILADLAQEEQRKAIEPDERRGMIEAFLDRPVRADWESLSVEERIRESAPCEFGVEAQPPVDGKNYILRQTVTAIELWVECFQKPRSDFATYGRQFGLEVKSIMASIDGWERSGRISSKAYGNRMPGYRRIQNNTDLR